MIPTNERLHWTQRVALVRHNLHSASRSGDFTFFKTLQVNGFFEGTDHVATLTANLGDAADTLLSTLDNLNAGIAYVHQDAFKKVYDTVKSVAVHDALKNTDDRSAYIYVDAAQQRQIAHHAIDKMTTSAVALILQQPPVCQETAANVWIMGTTVVADAIQVCLTQIDRIEQQSPEEFIRLEESWTVVKSAVESATSAFKGIFTLMSPGISASDALAKVRARTGSGFYPGGMLRRLSTAWSPTYIAAPQTSPTFRPPFASPSHSRRPSLLRTDVAAACPTKLPPNGIQHSMLETVPCTPPIPAHDEDRGGPLDQSSIPIDKAALASSGNEKDIFLNLTTSADLKKLSIALSEMGVAGSADESTANRLEGHFGAPGPEVTDSSSHPDIHVVTCSRASNTVGQGDGGNLDAFSCNWSAPSGGELVDPIDDNCKRVDNAGGFLKRLSVALMPSQLAA